MLRAELKRNLLPMALIALGCLILLAIVFFLFRSQWEMVGWVLVGSLMIGAGVLGIVITRPKNKNPAGDESAPASSVPPSPPTAPQHSAVGGWKITTPTPGPEGKAVIPKPWIIGGSVLLASGVLLLLCNLATTVLSLFTVRETQIIDCREAPLYAEEGWKFVSSYSYSADDAVAGETIRTACVMEQERFVWDKDKRSSRDEGDAEDEFAPEADLTPEGDASADDFAPALYVTPMRTPLVQPLATPSPWSSPTGWSATSPLSTATPPSSLAP
ncbi:MAG TPA: hypothetical protein PLH19_04975 [Anaerolineae bacterium]|nr:hypothetical protein [Anaerolineae bacterium]HQH37877.1 hypothetical protein [Anaerolineae bacterium]